MIESGTSIVVRWHHAARRVSDGWKLVLETEKESLLLSMFIALPFFVLFAPIVFVLAFFIERSSRES